MRSLSVLKIMLLMFVLLKSAYAQTSEIQAKVYGVMDGDTISVVTLDKKQIKIRLSQIDAPESKQPQGQKSKQSLSDLVYGKTVTIKTESVDKYGRTIGTIFVNGVDVNLEQIKRGMAWFYTQYGHDSVYREAEKKAKSQRIGLWNDSAPTPPWEWRHGSKLSSSTVSTSPSLSSCGVKQYCKEMSSCAEAQMYLTKCGRTKLDRDRDGVACESLCK
ncbi:nuclease [Iodobacter sp. HSC-16F04]|uniref:Nuclease n=1 Tax=Iodobacter violaceini TaxID=3044271 RepID=A0ABX0KQF0_9NEIS|nr:thermonuclease family protein [Iodobacter violacea]NHQ86825.1 nuclease [Iodobacter violacea]